MKLRVAKKLMKKNFRGEIVRGDSLHNALKRSRRAIATYKRCPGWTA